MTNGKSKLIKLFIGLIAPALFMNCGKNPTSEDLAAQLARPVVQRLVDWIRWRNQHPAFHGTFSMHLDPRNAAKLTMSWHHGDAFARLELDFERTHFNVDSSSLPAPMQGVGPR